MTIDEAIKHAKEVAEENQRVVDTGIVFNDVSIDMLYCDDTEVIEEHLSNYQRTAEEYRQISEWLKELKQLREQKPKTKVGKWIESHIPESVLVECSECGFSCGAPSFNYCPNCGAKMKIKE